MKSLKLMVLLVSLASMTFAQHGGWGHKGRGWNSHRGGNHLGHGNNHHCGNNNNDDSENCDLRTQTMGGWGAKPRGNNPGRFLHNNFNTAFPNGLTIGCAGGNTIELTNAWAVTNFLPSGGQPRTLYSSLTNPSWYRNTLAGQVTALALSVGFSDAISSFADDNLGDAVLKKGPFAGTSVRDFLAIANDVLGGCNSSYSINSINSVATDINESYVDGRVRDRKLLDCDVEPQCPEIDANLSAYNDMLCEDPNSICNQFDISNLAHGTEVNDYFSEYGIDISVIPGGPVSWNDAVIYNTNQDNTEDPDLNLNVGNVILINENPYNNDGDGMGPDDASTGGCLVFSYASPVTVNSFIFLDAEEEGGRTFALDANGDTVATAPILAVGNASVQTVVLNAENVSVLYICYPASGAVDLSLSCPQVAACSGSALASPSNGEAPYSYEWSTGDTTESISDLCAGTYTVTITDDNGCVEIDSVVVGIDTCLQKKGFEENIINIPGQEEITSFETNVYPNPFSENVNLNFTASATTRVKAEVVSIEGKQVAMLYDDLAYENETYRFNMNGNDLSAGMYLYRLVTENGDVHVSKLLLTK